MLSLATHVFHTADRHAADQDLQHLLELTTMLQAVAERSSPDSSLTRVFKFAWVLTNLASSLNGARQLHSIWQWRTLASGTGESPSMAGGASAGRSTVSSTSFVDLDGEFLPQVHPPSSSTGVSTPWFPGDGQQHAGALGGASGQSMDMARVDSLDEWPGALPAGDGMDAIGTWKFNGR